MPIRPAHRRLLLSCYALMLTNWLPVHSLAQTLSESVDKIVATGGAVPAGSGPFIHGFNASLGTSSQHDSSNGWSSVLTPGVSYRINRAFSINASVPIYAYINIYENTGTKAKPVYHYITKNGVTGDTALTASYEAPLHWFGYEGFVTLGLPSGNTAYGLGAGQPTYDLNNHFEKDLGIFTPDIELGIGDSSALVDSAVRKSYTSVGTIAHFQAGSSVDLPFDMNFEADAYEVLPLGAQTIYSTTGKGKKKATTATGESSGEDNGFITSLDIPLNPHVVLSGFYNRSLRDHDDVAGFSFVFQLRALPKHSESKAFLK